MAKYQKYAEYKDSGVEWLGEIPRHWDSKPLKYLCTYNDEVLPETTAKDAEIQYIDIGSVSAVDGISKIETMIFKDAPSRARRIVRDGDVIVSTVRTYLEAIAPINNPPENLIVSTGFAVIRPNQYLYKSFASYCLRAKGFIKEVVARSVGVSYPAINSSDLVNITIPSIGYVEQVKIANFLDHETAKIDTLIAKQEKLIELLKEKRQAVISHAVTKGLNPDVAMKDSGVEWLGEVPEHWEGKPLKYLCTYNDDTLSETTPKETEIQYIDIGSVSAVNGISKIETMIFKDAPSRARRIVRDGDVIVSTVRTYLEAIASIDNPPENLVVSTGFIVIRPNQYLYKGFASYCLRAKGFIKEVIARSVGVSYPAINSSDLVNISIPSLEYCEQMKITNFLDSQTAKIDELIRKAESAIELMQERRTALISSAVTGKIDVRNWQNPNYNNNEANTELGA